MTEPTYGRVRVTEHGALEIDGASVLSMGWSMRANPSDVVTLTVTLPVVDLSVDGKVRLAYISDIHDPMSGPEVEADTPQAALRALADRLDELDTAK